MYERTCSLVSIREHIICSSDVFFAATVAPKNRPSKSLKFFDFYLFKNVDGILFTFSRKCSTKEKINCINVWKGKYFDRVITFPYVLTRKKYYRLERGSTIHSGIKMILNISIKEEVP